MRIVITGGQGQLARDLVLALAGDEVVALDRSALDVTDRSQIQSTFESFQPEVIINTAAYHGVDLCEDEPEMSFAVNAAAPQRLAAACEVHGATLVHVSTDYVFNGASRRPYAEDHPVDPINVYGSSKAAGEMAIRATTARHLIVRTTGLYGIGGMMTSRGNFVETMLRLSDGGRPVSVVSDQILTPSNAMDVADVIAQLIRMQARGTYHVTNAGQCSWFEFAAEILRLVGRSVDLHPTTQRQRPSRASRPAYSVLSHVGLRRLEIDEPRDWRAGLAHYLEKRCAAEANSGSAARHAP
jgi:dTDP-4-dehydrorhamnose reductase